MKPNYKIYALILFFIYIVIIWPMLQKQNLTNSNIITPNDNPSATGTTTSDISETPSSINPEDKSSKEVSKIVVDLRGAIKNPGIYHLSSDARMYELIKMAGGLDHANVSCINKAQIISDESQIIIPKVEEECSNIDSPLPTNNSAVQVTTQKININYADVSTLSTLPGIGATRAQDIINYRDTNGNFQKIEDIKNVSGIGEQTFSNIQELISI